MHGGSIEARSKGRGLGSEFTIRLPVADVSISGGMSVEASKGVTRINRRVVVIDDDADVARSIARLVSALGGKARVAHSGEDGLALIRNFRPDGAA
jgi:PleD family two-component response regulator